MLVEFVVGTDLRRVGRGLATEIGRLGAKRPLAGRGQSDLEPDQLGFLAAKCCQGHTARATSLGRRFNRKTRYGVHGAPAGQAAQGPLTGMKNACPLFRRK